LSSFQIAYGLLIEVSAPLPGLLNQPKQLAADMHVGLNATPAFLSELLDSPGDFYSSGANSGADGDPTLRVATLSGGQYYGFFYADGVRFAVERGGREIWGDWPRDYALDEIGTGVSLAGLGSGIVRFRRSIASHHPDMG
jgi:hypothetical protein